MRNSTVPVMAENHDSRGPTSNTNGLLLALRELLDELRALLDSRSTMRPVFVCADHLAPTRSPTRSPTHAQRCPLSPRNGRRGGYS